MSLHINKGKTVAESLKDRLDYALNAEKRDHNIDCVSSYMCAITDPEYDFMLIKNIAGHSLSPRKNEVIAYQIRQSFAPGEVTPEEANRIGCELAMKYTCGTVQFVVGTHLDREHVLYC
jgi:hypothetical protein